MKNLKGVEEFIYVFIVAIIVLAVLMLLFAWGPMPTEEYISLAEFSSIGSVGYLTNEPSRTDMLGSFNVGVPQTEDLKSIPQVSISAGFLGGEVESYEIGVPDYLLSLSDKIRVSFRVYSTNNYGNLIIKWNGLEFFNQLAGEREYGINIGPDYIEETNTLEVYCAGPGAAFWASTVYVLQDFEVVLDYGPSLKIPFQLSETELGSLNKIGLVFTGTSESSLNIKVNENNIYNADPQGFTEIEFSPSNVPLSIGNNILSFNTPTGVSNLQSVELQIFLTSNVVTRTREFNITQLQYTYLQQDTMQGKIDYNIDNLVAQGSLEIKLNDHVLNTPLPQEGSNTVYFTDSEAEEGMNTLIFKGTGQFEIGETEVSLEL